MPRYRDGVKCSYCNDTGWHESDYDPGWFYPCHTCNPRGRGIPSSVVLAVDPSRSIPPPSAVTAVAPPQGAEP